MELCMKECWRKLTNAEDWDDDGDGHISSQELERHIDAVFAKFDSDGDGLIDAEELGRLYDKGEERLTGRRRTTIGSEAEAGMGAGHKSLMVQMVKALDKNGDGKVDRQELAAIVR
jgi:Ca2+-binding EF-hand superfamily protein